MGRFATLNAETQDLVNALLPALAVSFRVSDVVDIIPEDIRMRAWDCERRDHIKELTENDPRNWGVQFLKDLMAISRLKNGNLNEFQDDLRAKVELHEPKHPWCRLGDIKDIKDEYEHPGRKAALDLQQQQVSDSGSSTDSYFEELVEPELPRGSKRRRGELYEARIQESTKKRKLGRLRRSPEGGFHRKDKSARKRSSIERDTPNSSRQSASRATYTIHSSRENSMDTPARMPLPSHISGYSMSPAPQGVQLYQTEAINSSNEPIAVLKLAAELEVAEAELKAARLKYQYLHAREQAEKGDGNNRPKIEETSYTLG